MKVLNVAAAAVNQTPLDWEGNTTRIATAIRYAQEAGVQVLTLPELAVCGYGCEDLFHTDYHAARSWKELKSIATVAPSMVVCVGAPVRFRGKLFNCAAFLYNGDVAALVAKQFLANDGVHYETRWFSPWPQGEKALYEGNTPIGDLTLAWGDVTLGAQICEDAWVPKRPSASLAARGAEVICNPSASHFSLRKRELRREIIREDSRATGTTILQANLLGCEAGRIIFDGDTTIATTGMLVAEGSRFSFEEVVLTTAVIDLEDTRRHRVRTYGSPISVSSIADVLLKGSPVWSSEMPFEPEGPDIWETDIDTLEFEEFTRAVTLGLFDYFRKSRAKGFVVGLSGGADSSAVSCLVALTIEKMVEELSEAQLIQRLPHLEELLRAADEKSLHAALLLCAYQRTASNSAETEQSARALADELGATFVNLDIEDVTQKYVALVQEALGQHLTWEENDFALQNIYSRARTPSIWLLANVRSALLLTTGNRSEIAVGYSTMDGDTSGGFNPIGGVSKEFLRDWLKWLENSGFEERRIKALGKVNQLKPSAELRPLDREQTDEDDLMPYAVLNMIEWYAVREGRSPLDTYRLVREKVYFGGDAGIKKAVIKFFRMLARSQWKRERSAPSFHIDDYSLDSRSWFRFPILSAGFKEEIAELERDLPPESEEDIAAN